MLLFPPFPSFFIHGTRSDLETDGVEDEVQGAALLGNSSRQMSHVNVVYLHCSQGKEEFKRADSNINLFQLFMLQVIL